jgi:hypothetical protein
LAGSNNTTLKFTQQLSALARILEEKAKRESSSEIEEEKVIEKSSSLLLSSNNNANNNNPETDSNYLQLQQNNADAAVEISTTTKNKSYMSKPTSIWRTPVSRSHRTISQSPKSASIRQNPAGLPSSKINKNLFFP